MSRKSLSASAAERAADLAVELAAALVRIPSESSEAVATDLRDPEGRVGEYLGAFCQRQGLEHEFQAVVVGRRNLVVRRRRPEAPAVVLAAHMDTVSAAGMEEPFAGKLHDGRLWGRGACDDKGPLATALAVLACLDRPAYDITLVATVDEECSLAGAATAAARLPAFDLGIALEPTECRVVVAHKGMLRLEIATSGVAAHSSAPDQGVNAISRMVPVIAELESLHRELQAGADPQLGPPTVTVTTVHGGSSLNIVPDRCTATVDVRLLPGMAATAMVDDIRARLGEGVSVRVLFDAPGIRTDGDNPLVQRLRDAVRLQGGDDTPAAVSFATDCSRLSVKGPCIVWGPGSIRQAHQREEWIALDEIRRACAVLHRFLAAEGR